MNQSVIEKPLVSIILPTYKRANVLPIALHSILNQTYANLELIIVDDNSPDNTAEIVQSFTDPRIHYVKNNPNLKLPKALNKGFSLSHGKYLTWTSDDNIYEPTAIEKMVERIQSSNCEFVYADYYFFVETDLNGQPLAPHHNPLPSQVQLEKSNHIGACFLYTRRVYEEIGEYDPELFLVEDYDFFMRVAKKFKMCHIAEPLYYFRRDDATLYCSRFCEVKASDVLVRYKNGLLDKQAAIDVVVMLILDNIDHIKNPLLRWTYPVVRKISYRLTSLHKSITTDYLHHNLSSPVEHILDKFTSGYLAFMEARDELKDLMQLYGTIQYNPPSQTTKI